MENFILKSDAYKQTHHLQYPEGTEYVYSYNESRGGDLMKFFEEEGEGRLATVFKDGHIIKEYTFNEVKVYCAI